MIMDPRHRPDRAQDRLIHAALALISERGLGGVTMSAVARRADVSRQTLYNHYQDVESIVSAAIAQHEAESIDRLSALMTTVTAPLERLTLLVRHVAATHASGHPMIRHGFSPEVQEIIDGYDRALRSHVELILVEGVAAGIFRDDIDPPRDAVVLQRMIEAGGELAAQDPDAIAETAAAVIAMAEAAVTARTA